MTQGFFLLVAFPNLRILGENLGEQVANPTAQVLG
jgi:hypothetical protein